jgi:putative flippase GtrA
MNKIKELFVKYQEIINYLIFGVLTTIVSLATYYILTVTILDPKVALELQIANVISWIAAVNFAYFSNRKWVFKNKNKASLSEAGKFYLARVSTLLVDMGLMFIFVTKMGVNDKIMKIIVQVVITVLNYVFSKFIVFKEKKNENK